jgi:hypothetical protein
VTDAGLPHHPEDTAELLRRAQEIDEQTRLMLQPYPEYTELICAAEEAGIARDATLQALRERMSLPVQAFEPGRRVFAKSADGHFYAATLESLNGRTANLRFVNGSDHVADMTDLRLFSLTPGQRVWFNSPSYGVWMQSEVVRFNPDSSSVTVNAWYQEETVPLEKIRLNKERSPFQPPAFKLRDDMKMAAIGFAGLIAGTGLGIWIARLLGG